MDGKPYYAPLSLETKSKILSHLDKTLDDLAKCLQEIKAWLKTQKHLPEEPSDRMVEFFLLATRFDMDLIKEKLDYYYSVRSEMPEVFLISNPRSPSMIATLDFTQFVPLPKLIDHSDKVIVVKLRNAYAPYDFDAHSWLAAVLNIHEVIMQQDIALYSVMLYDLENLSLNHVLKMSPKMILNTAKLLERLFSDRVQHLHVINYPTIFQLVLSLSKSLIKPDLYEKFVLHNSNESLANYIPLDILPENYGGHEKSLDELEVLWRKRQTEYQDRYDKLESLRVDESLRTTPRKQPEGLLESFSNLFK